MNYKNFILLLSFLLVVSACKKDSPSEKIPPKEGADAYTSLIGRWQLMKITDSNNGGKERNLSNCRRHSSITFLEGRKAREVRYHLALSEGESADRGEGTCKHSNDALSVAITNSNTLQLIGTETETYTYTLKDKQLQLVLTATLPNGDSVSSTFFYQKDYTYNPAKELIGTWYVHHWWADGAYNWDDNFEPGRCKTKEKIVFTETDITIYQYDIGSEGCKETIYQGSYKVSENQTKIIVSSKRNGFVGNTIFDLENGNLHIYGNRSGHALETIYRKDKKYEDYF